MILGILGFCAFVDFFGLVRMGFIFIRLKNFVFDFLWVLILKFFILFRYVNFVVFFVAGYSVGGLS